MKRILILLALLLAALFAYSKDLKPFPDMSSAKVSSAKEAEAIVLQHIISDPNDGLSATESVVAKLSLSLGIALPQFGKKGDRVWQIHRVSFGDTTSVIWVNAETTAVKMLYPQKK
jgi:hypothetical protein